MSQSRVASCCLVKIRACTGLLRREGARVPCGQRKRGLAIMQAAGCMGGQRRLGSWSSRSSPTSSCCSQGLQIHEDVKEYYGKLLQNSKDLKTNACVTPSKPVPKFIRDALTEVHDEVSSRYYGCGLVVPECLENCRILDLGSGSGRDCYVLSMLVGPKGHVTGVDMTDEQVEIARKYIDYHRKKFGYQEPNINFVSGYIEDVKAAGIGDQSYDIIISNCVINLTPDKKAVLREAYRVLKDGGEIYFSDVYSNKPVPDELRENKVLWGECISGALFWKDLYLIAEEIGFSPPRLVTSSYITVNNKELENIIGDLKFVSATYRLFKLPQNSVTEKGLVIYNGGITGCENEIQFDTNFTFKEGEATSVDEELWSILKTSRFSDEFLFQSWGKEGTSTQCCIEKEIIKDPFQLTEDQKKSSSPPSCCGPKGCC
ncbi:LOW QUALITY PROTEIN: arsenite methyltransferase-like [Bufo gargarizans]|uniref:LOW QUALITY PROTEIN: arsenite methyltransferase-like n=1 Tax=Bufo gargarizans TaxID=30331 RepID=UPI001CF3FFE2|nr:LOW QUALITY PROTEIN: arsenite methyltransferase-like [Bufo gargarizans]